MDHLWSTLAPAAVGVLLGAAAPWPLKAAWRWLRGEAEIEGREREAEAGRGARAAQAELNRLLKEIARQAERNSDLEELVDLLRKALDKHLIRESAIASVCELLIALARLVEQPSAAMLHIRDRAQQLLEDARAQTIRIDQGVKHD